MKYIGKSTRTPAVRLKRWSDQQLVLGVEAELANIDVLAFEKTGADQSLEVLLSGLHGSVMAKK